jgi:hypothetical protein
MTQILFCDRLFLRDLIRGAGEEETQPIGRRHLSLGAYYEDRRTDFSP